MSKRIYTIFCLSLLLVSCDNGKKEIQALNESLSKISQQLSDTQKELDECKKELDGYRYSPENLCANIEQLLKDEDINELSAIKETLQKYHPTASQIKTVESYISKINDIQTKRAEAEKAKRMQAVNVLTKKYDDIKGINWYYSKKLRSSGSYMRLYMGQDKSGSVWLRLNMQYNGDDWIFFEHAYLSYDENTIEINFDKYNDKETDNGYGDVWEWIDVSVDSSIESFIKRLADGKSSKWRVSGKYSKTYTLSEKEKEGLKEILLAYDVLKKGV